MARPCDEGKHCQYAQYDWSNELEACAIDFDGTDCPYIKPWGKKRYEREHKKDTDNNETN